MLVLMRKPGDSITLGPDIVIKVLAIEGGQVKLGIQAPKHVAVDRPPQNTPSPKRS